MNRRSFIADMLNTGISFVFLGDGLIWNACFETTEAMIIATLSPMTPEELLKMCDGSAEKFWNLFKEDA